MGWGQMEGGESEGQWRAGGEPPAAHKSNSLSEAAYVMECLLTA